MSHRSVLASLLTFAAVLPIAGLGCTTPANEIIDPPPTTAPPPPAAAAHGDLVTPASAETTAQTGITSWVSELLPDGASATLGKDAHGTRIRLSVPPYTSHTAGSLALTIYDDAGTAISGWLTVLDGVVVDSKLPPQAATVVARMSNDLAHTPEARGWSECNYARQALADASAVVAAADAAVFLASVGVGFACTPPILAAAAPCVEALQIEAAAIAARLAAVAAESSAAATMHAACDNLCTGDDWCTSRYGGNTHCNSEGSCEQVTTTYCVPCSAVSCGWDYSCVTTNNPAPTLCPCDDGGGGGEGGGGWDPGGGGGGEPSCNIDDCFSECLGYGSCIYGTCMGGT